MMISYYKQNDSSYEPLYSSKDDAQAAIDGYVATLGITDDDTVLKIVPLSCSHRLPW